MKFAALISMMAALIALLTWDIVLRIDGTEQPLTFPSKAAQDSHDLHAFHDQFWSIVKDHKEENQRPEQSAAIAAAGFKAVRELGRLGTTTGTKAANNALREAWNTIDIIRSIHGDDGPETTFVYSIFFNETGVLNGHVPDTDVLLPVLDSAWETAKVPGGRNDQFGKTSSLGHYINSQISRCAFLSNAAFNSGNLEWCTVYRDHAEALLSIPWIDTLYTSKHILDRDWAQRQYDQISARFLILNQQFGEAKALLDSMEFPNRPVKKAAFMVALYEAWHAAEPGAGHEVALRTWLTDLIELTEQKAGSSNGNRRREWQQQADEAREQLETLETGD